MCIWSEAISQLSRWQEVFAVQRSQAINEPISRAEGYTVPGLSLNSMLGLGTVHVSVPKCIPSQQPAMGMQMPLSLLPLPSGGELEPPVPAETILLMEHLYWSPITSLQIRQWTRRDPLLARVICHVQDGWSERCTAEELRPFASNSTELSVHDGCLSQGMNAVTCSLPSSNNGTIYLRIKLCEKKNILQINFRKLQNM